MPKRIDDAIKKAGMGKPLKKSIPEINREMEERAIEQRALQNDLKYINLQSFPLNPEIVGLISKDIAKMTGSIILSETNKEMKIGTVNTTSKEFQNLKKKLEERGYKIDVFLISKSSFDEALQLYIRVTPKRENKQIKVELTKEELTHFQKDIQNIQQLEEKIKKLPITKVLDIIIAGAIQTDASDIHIEPEENDTKLRYRIDGVLQDVANLSRKEHPPIISRIKLLSKLKLNITDTPQDGRFTINLGKKKIDVRTSILPSGYGETAVLRLLGMEATSLKLDDLGFNAKDHKKIQDEIEKPNGMILTTGPTGSGKTTTLYAFLNQINSPEIKIITLENPIEYRLEGISQTQVEKEKGYDFATGLRSILRQDPDVVMVGEIRDLETAETALNAALTGHLVFSTLHTNDAAGVIPRLIDMGARPFVIAPAINAVIAQRLVRRLCDECKQEYTPDEKELERINRMFNIQNSAAKLPEIKKLYKTPEKECKKCNNTGYKGRIGIFELFVIDKEMEKLIMSAATTAEIFEAAILAGMMTMAQDGILKAIEGITSIEEVDRVT